MNIFTAILLGTIQGLTEFIPVSSTGHLIVAEKFLGVSGNGFGLTFDASLHIATLLALIVYFREKLIDLLQMKKYRYLLVKFFIATIPAFAAGFFLESIVATVFRNVALVALSLIIFSFVFLAAEYFGKKIKSMKDMKNWHALAIGTAQVVALVPGVSRSGITISAGLFAGLSRKDAAEFAFLLAIPVIAGAGGKKLFDALFLYKEGIVEGSDITALFFAMTAAFIVGYATIRYLLAYFKKGNLYPFVIYRILLGFILLFIS